MAITNRERVDRALEQLRAGLAPFVERELESTFPGRALDEARRVVAGDRLATDQPLAAWDIAALLRLMWDGWNTVFRKTLGHAERSLVSELRDTRNHWAHQKAFSGDDTYRALDSAARLLTAISAPQAAEVERAKMELLRVRFDEQLRSEKRRTAGTAIEAPGTPGLKPWREVVTPHRDVASGHYQQAEFAADLWQVHIGEGSAEYRDPAEFFRRTYLTDSLEQLLRGAVRRLGGVGGDPVVQLQTNFGGGKTHSMLALYHLFSGIGVGQLAGVETVLQDLEAPIETATLPRARQVVLVGNKISPGNPTTKPDGTVIRTLWGELAWQLGHAAGGETEARRAFERIRADDERATNPGDALRELMNAYAPSLILIDEWVAYARQLHDQSDLPGGSFETQFTFAQALTESAKLADRCLLVVSLPASDTAGSPHAVADDVEVGGERGRAALDRLRNAVGRVETSWRPASAEEGFEIVRRRLFEPLVEQEQFVARDAAARAFYDLYRTQHQEFPAECREPDYEMRLRAAYPIHPEIFDRLYGDWSTLLKFQRTRGVLRLMAAVIHSLWERDDRNPLILPANIAIDDTRVQFELTRYLSDNWTPVIEKDVDGPNALSRRLDGELPNLGKYAACRRVARTIYLGSAPTATAAHRGIEDRRVRLGCVMPGESPAVFGDALRRLAAAATYLYQDGARYWYSTQPTVTKVAEDRAEQLRRDPDAVAQEIEKRLRTDLRQTGPFARVHPMPSSGQEVPDDLDAALVVLGPTHPHSKGDDSPALAAAREMFETRGSAPRLFRNSLVFLAVDQSRLQDLDEATRRFLAWQSILAEREELDLSPHQVKQAEIQRASADGAVAARLPEAYQWLLVPRQDSPQGNTIWETLRLSGQAPLAQRAGKKLLADEALITELAGTSLRKELDRVPLWRGDHVSLRQLAEDFGRYPYLPRLADSSVLYRAVEDGLGLAAWRVETFAFADSHDSEANRYLGLRGGQRISAGPGSSGLLVQPDVAWHQLEAEAPTAPLPGATPQPESQASAATPASLGAVSTAGGSQAITDPEPAPGPRRFHGSVELDPVRMSRDANQIAEEVITHLAAPVGAKVKITLEIEAELPSGAEDHLVRTVTENSRTLKFKHFGFEDE